jgi:hypothetical protein
MDTSTLQDKRFWLVAAALVSILIAAVGWLFFISPKLSATSSLRDQTQQERDQESVLLAKSARLKKQYENIDALRSELATTIAGLPGDSGLPALTTQLATAAAAHNVQLTSIVIGSIAPVSATSGASGATATTGSAAGSIFKIPVTIVSGGTLPNELAFLKDIENGARTATVGSTQFGVATGGTVASIDNGTTLTVQVSVYSAPQTPSQAAALQKLLNGPTTN